MGNLFSAKFSSGQHQDLLQHLESLQKDQELSDDINWEDYNQVSEQLFTTHKEGAHATPRAKLGSAAFSMRPSEFTSKAISIDRHPFSFSGREYLHALYDPIDQYYRGSRNILVLSGRQCEKSSTQSAKTIALASLNTAFKSLYVAPRWDQVRVFSGQRFRPMCEDSPALSDWVKPTRTIWKVTERAFMNGSFFNFRSCYLSADNARGITCEMLLLDELQDLLSDTVPILEQTQSHATLERRYRLYAGTPKTTSNVLTRRWQNTCQFEWVHQCSSCKYDNIPGPDIIADDCYRCAKCRKPINPKIGMWVPQQPSLLEKSWGFRIPQIIVPFKEHSDMIEARDDPNSTERAYYNETLGLPYDVGRAIITENQLRAVCSSDAMSSLSEINQLANQGVPVFAGIDYGTGEGTNPSYTVLTIGYPILGENKFKVAYIKKFKGQETNLSEQPRLLNEIMRQAGVRVVGADWGFGADKNSRLVHEFGWNRISGLNVLMEYMYTTQDKFAKWNPNAQRYHVSRNQAIEFLAESITKQKIEFFRWEELQQFHLDYISIYAEYDSKRNLYTYDHESPDDGFHSLVYAYFSMLQFHNMLVRTSIPRLS